ncbi:MAG TPA: hypothetical protein VJ464_04200 [Blastocatellia bacterium]|nr:hypothetical protein [Blastocatellia bacterium]
MKRVVFVAIMLAFAVSAGVRSSAARVAGQGGAELLNALPDGNAVLLIDVQRITSSQLWGMLSGQEKFRAAFEKIQSELSEAGISLSDVQTVAVSFANGNTNNPAVAVSGRLNQSALLARLRADEKIKLTSETYKGVEVFKVESVNQKASKPNEAGGFAFLDATTAVAGTPTSVRAAIDVKTGSRASIAQNAKLTEALATTTGAVRFALEMSSIAGKLPTGPMGDFSSIKMIFGGVDVTNGVDLNATLRNDTVEHARALTTQLTGLLEMARGFLGASNDPKMAPLVTALKSITITGNDIDVRVTGNVPMEVLAQILR